jgi:dihydrofolate reductase
MIGAYAIHGHAIVSDDDKVAGPDGLTPAVLRNAADWRRFQQALDGAAVIVLGRKGHEANPDRHGRKRIVLSSSARGLERRNDAWWWNPAEVGLEAALESAAPGGGIVAVPGGRAVYDLFLKLGFDEFHLVRARGVLVPGGVKLFSECGPKQSAEAVLTAHGLVPGPSELLDAAAGVVLTVWRRPATP